MQIHEDSKVQHTSSNGLQRPACDSCFRVTGFADYSATEKAGTLRAGGGGSENLVLHGVKLERYVWGKVGALCATDYKWVQQEQVEQGKIIPVLATHLNRES